MFILLNLWATTTTTAATIYDYDFIFYNFVIMCSFGVHIPCLCIILNLYWNLICTYINANALSRTCSLFSSPNQWAHDTQIQRNARVHKRIASFLFIAIRITCIDVCIYSFSYFFRIFSSPSTIFSFYFIFQLGWERMQAINSVA